MIDMARTRFPYPSAQPVYAAARRWRDRSLLDDLSLFGADLLGQVRALAEHINVPTGAG